MLQKLLYFFDFSLTDQLSSCTDDRMAIALEEKPDRSSSTSSESSTGQIQAPVSQMMIILVIVILVTVIIGPFIIFIVVKTGKETMPQVSSGCALHDDCHYGIPYISIS